MRHATSILIKKHSTASSRQSGVVLVIGLIILLVMTITGISTIQRSTFQERMAANTDRRITIFQSAEAALRAGEDRAFNEQVDVLENLLVNRFITSSSDRLPDPGASSWAGEIAVDATSAYAIFYKGKSVASGSSSADESTATATGYDGYYYIFARATSAQGATVVLQSTINRRF